MGICNSKDSKREKGVAPEQPKGDANSKPGPAVIQDQSSIQPPNGPPGEPEEIKSYESLPSGEEHSGSEEEYYPQDISPWNRGCSTWEAHNLSINYPSKNPLNPLDLLKLKTGPTAENIKSVYEYNEKCKINGAKPDETHIEWENPFRAKGTNLRTEPETNEGRQIYLDQLLTALYRSEDILYAQYKTMPGFEENNKDFYEKEHWKDWQLCTLGCWFKYRAMEFVHRTKKDYEFKYSHIKTIVMELEGGLNDDDEV
jgi:hypothetical protein